MLWKGFIEGVEFINDRVVWIIGNRESINEWRCNWVLHKKKKKNGMRKPFSSIINPDRKVKDFGMWKING